MLKEHSRSSKSLGYRLVFYTLLSCSFNICRALELDKSTRLIFYFLIKAFLTYFESFVITPLLNNFIRSRKGKYLSLLKISCHKEKIIRREFTWEQYIKILFHSGLFSWQEENCRRSQPYLFQFQTRQKAECPPNLNQDNSCRNKLRQSPLYQLY